MNQYTVHYFCYVSFFQLKVAEKTKTKKKKKKMIFGIFQKTLFYNATVCIHRYADCLQTIEW